MSIRSPSFGSFAALLLCVFMGCAGADPGAGEMRESRVAGVRLDARTASPIVDLIETENEGRRLSIWIGEFEAQSIARAIEHAPIVRPNPHDLLTDVLRRLEGKVARTRITELREGTYYAVIEVALGDRELSIDARPSDAIALALRAGAPIFVHDELFSHDKEIPDDDDALDVDFPREREESPDGPST